MEREEEVEADDGGWGEFMPPQSPSPPSDPEDSMVFAVQLDADAFDRLTAHLDDHSAGAVRDSGSQALLSGAESSPPSSPSSSSSPPSPPAPEDLPFFPAGSPPPASASPPPPPAPPPPPRVPPLLELAVAHVRECLEGGGAALPLGRLPPEAAQPLVDSLFEAGEMTPELLRRFEGAALQRVRVRGGLARERWLEAALLFPLRELELEDCAGVEDAALLAGGAPARAHGTLVSLSLSSCARLTRRGLGGVARFRRLERVSLGGTEASNGAVRALLAAAAGTLTDLDLQHCPRLTASGLEPLAPGRPPLRRLDLSHCPRLRGPALAHVARATTLRELRLRGLAALQDAHAPPLRALVSLERLDLYSARNLTDAGLVPALGPLRALRRLCLANTGAGAATVEALAASAPLLAELHLTGAQGVGAEGLAAAFEALGRGCPALAELRVRGLLALDDRAVECAGRLAGLRRVNVSGCRSVVLTAHHVRALAGGGALESLQARDVAWTPRGFAALARLPLLEYLDVSRASGPQPGELPSLAAASLTHLDLSFLRLDRSDLARVGRLARLRLLRLKGVRAPGGEPLHPHWLAPLGGLLSLRSLNLSLSGAGDAHLLAFCARLTRVDWLHAKGCPLTSAGLAALLPSAGAMRHLSLAGCGAEATSSAAALAVLARLTGLAWLDLSSAAAAGDGPSVSASLSPRSRRAAAVAGGPLPAGAVELLCTLRRLEELSLGGESTPKAADMLRHGRGLARLRALRINGAAVVGQQLDRALGRDAPSPAAATPPARPRRRRRRRSRRASSKDG